MSEQTVSNHVGFLQVGPGGICFAHGPYESQDCPSWPTCAGSPWKAEYVRMGFSQIAQQEPRTPEIADLERAVVEAAIVWRQMHPEEKTLWIASAVDNLIAAREK